MLPHWVWWLTPHGQPYRFPGHLNTADTIRRWTYLGLTAPDDGTTGQHPRWRRPRQCWPTPTLKKAQTVVNTAGLSLVAQGTWPLAGGQLHRADGTGDMAVSWGGRFSNSRRKCATIERPGLEKECNWPWHGPEISTGCGDLEGTGERLEGQH